MVSKAAILPLILTATSLAFFTLIHLFVFLSIQGFLAQRSLFSRCFHSNGGDGVGELEKETQRKKKSKNLGAITVFKLEKATCNPIILKTATVNTLMYTLQAFASTHTSK